MKKFLFLPILFLVFTACKDEEVLEPACDDITTDARANLDEFLGVWHEISTIPEPWNTGCMCTTATYTLAPEGDAVIVLNQCDVEDRQVIIEGQATQPDPEDFTKLIVSFPSVPFPGNYWILEFEAGSHMLVGSPDFNNLFVLSRTPTLSDAIYQSMLDKAESMCFDTTRLAKTNQTGC